MQLHRTSNSTSFSQGILNVNLLDNQRNRSSSLIIPKKFIPKLKPIKSDIEVSPIQLREFEIPEENCEELTLTLDSQLNKSIDDCEIRNISEIRKELIDIKKDEIQQHKTKLIKDDSFIIMIKVQSNKQFDYFNPDSMADFYEKKGNFFNTTSYWPSQYRISSPIIYHLTRSNNSSSIEELK